MASRLRHLRARALKAAFALHREIYERSDGRLGARFGLPMLLLSTVGRRSGEWRTTPLVYFRDGERYVVVGSDGAARKDPHWCENLRVNPRARVRVGRRQIDVVAEIAVGDERARLFEAGRRVNPVWASYQERTTRELPVVLLSVAGA